jgi:phosphoenolpyruvate carboxykinase (GTP)
MTRMGQAALAALGENGDFVPCLHSVGGPLAPGQEDVPWPCDPDNIVIAHFPEERTISWRATRAGSLSTC